MKNIDYQIGISLRHMNLIVSSLTFFYREIQVAIMQPLKEINRAGMQEYFVVT